MKIWERNVMEHTDMEELKISNNLKTQGINEEDLLGEEVLRMSESENEEDEGLTQSERNQISDGCSNDENQKISNKLQTSEQTEITSLEDTTNVNKVNKISSLIDSDSDIETQNVTKASKSRISAIIDSESESESKSEKENLNSFPEEKAREKYIDQPKISKPEKVRKIRVAAKKALDGMQAIQSEQQRLHREAYISVPYHKPKRYTLKEFLERKTIIKPYLQEDKTIPRRNLKMTQEELEEYAKLMEERAKEATEFFKSESDDEKDTNDNAQADAAPTKQFESDGEIKSMEKSNGVVILDNQLLVEPSTSAATSSFCNKETDAGKDVFVPSKKSFAENIRHIINEKNLAESPTIKGDRNMIIDLETGDIIPREPNGVDKLLERFITSSGSHKKKKTNKSLGILSTEKGKVEISNVILNTADDSCVNKEIKPGSAYFKLKDSLRLLISQKRKQAEEEKRKCAIEEQKKLDERSGSPEPDNDTRLEKEDKFKNILIDDEENEIEINDEDEEDFDDGQINNDECSEIADNSENDNEIDDGSAADDENDDDDVTSITSRSKAKRNKRIVKGFHDDSDSEDSRFLEPHPVSDSTLTNLNDLIEKETVRNVTDEENEILDLLSGRFSQSTQKPLLTQIPANQNIDAKNVEHEEELLNLCSGGFNTSGAASQINSDLPAPPKNYKIVSSDEEETNNHKENDCPKERNKIRKKKTKLGFSDDEENRSSSIECSEDYYDNEMPKTFVDYDSEENEIEVQLTKEDCLKQAENFLENQAELSESEWGSADENEENMNCYDIELGDEDNFDQKKLQSELGKIHLRKVLDDDIREVKKLQELFFEDEEIDGRGRQRQFRWKNMESGFSLDNNINETTDGMNANSDEDDENEHLWRKMRYERELLLKERNLDENLSFNSSDAGDITSSCTKKLNIITKKVTGTALNEPKQCSPFLISKTNLFSNKTTRGSFLVRDKETLQKFTGLIDINSASTNVKMVKPQNFLFHTLTEEEHVNLKRKTEDVSLLESECSLMKKPKSDFKRQKCLIDQLL